MDDAVLVTGATGKQGGAVARAVRAAGRPVRALVRDPGTEQALALAGAGIDLVTGDLDDPASVAAAARGARAVFSVQMPDLTDLLGDRELRHAGAIADAVRAAGVEQVVHTSVSGAGLHGLAGAVDPLTWGEHMPHYWRTKLAAERLLTGSGAGRVTVLRPAGFMENFLQPSMYHAGGDPERMILAADADVAQPFVALADIGAAAAAAFAESDRFDGVVLELAGERISFRAAAAALSEAWDLAITVSDDPEVARAAGLPEVFVRAQQFSARYPSPAVPQAARDLGLPTTGFTEWALAQRQALRLPSAR
ncbi:NmrA/HSCARG family protein [Pseudonocardia kongjuensis]|uniref:NmrA/HSCARG family protein n=1 Tax=Pseudonocardia kongjuensis TaxID=102227 RepID=A0ABP4I889_9PSEU